MNMEPKKLVIDESKWYRGKGSDKSKLRNGRGMMCCLGFYGLACGLENRDISGKSEPSDCLSLDDPKFPDWLTNKEVYSGNTSDCCVLMEINDEKSITDSSRKKQIKEIFAKHGVTVSFKKCGSKKAKA